jgi:hypothetical protein
MVYLSTYLELPESLMELEPYICYMSLSTRKQIVADLQEVVDGKEGIKRKRAQQNLYGIKVKLGLYLDAEKEEKVAVCREIMDFYFDFLTADQKPE